MKKIEAWTTSKSVRCLCSWLFDRKEVTSLQMFQVCICAKAVRLDLNLDILQAMSLLSPHKADIESLHIQRISYLPISL